jgi:hypothetical protein
MYNDKLRGATEDTLAARMLLDAIMKSSAEKIAVLRGQALDANERKELTTLMYDYLALERVMDILAGGKPNNGRLTIRMMGEEMLVAPMVLTANDDDTEKYDPLDLGANGKLTSVTGMGDSTAFALEWMSHNGQYGNIYCKVKNGALELDTEHVSFLTAAKIYVEWIRRGRPTKKR